ncbi:uncharacterized protein TNCV_513591 [Trichonephila clavipes]|nr:uncharacterized protein TNCV_513591 [Trichonephila clavipes]
MDRRQRYTPYRASCKQTTTVQSSGHGKTRYRSSSRLCRVSSDFSRCLPPVSSGLSVVSGSENVTEFLECIDNQIKLCEIPSDLSCAYVKSHLMGRALDWYQIFGTTLVQNTATDFARLKAALSKAFPAIQNRKDLETRFYASQQRQNQEPTDFVYDLLKLHKKLELGMSEKAHVDHIFVRLEPQVQDYVEVHNPQTAIQLLEVLAKFEERYSCKATLG